MNFARVEDWTALIGMDIDIRHNGDTVFSGIVDAVTPDGSILWVCPAGGTRRLFEKADRFQAWAAADDPAIQYRITQVHSSETA